jgi:hypothetical protein
VVSSVLVTTIEESRSGLNAKRQEWVTILLKAAQQYECFEIGQEPICNKEIIHKTGLSTPSSIESPPFVLRKLTDDTTS